jgi:acyl-CoA synthetase (AMP-forming)/AMP-acid ligase II
MLFERYQRMMRAEAEEQKLRKSIAYSHSSLNEEQKEMLIFRVQEVMSDAKVICQQDFTLAGLAKLVDSNTTYVSQVINEKYGMTFSILLGNHRVKEACRRISEEGEVLLKGPTITRGYYNRDDLTKAAFTEDGYFRTGDSGYLKDGELFLKERIKDLFKTSNGKYIAQQMIESKILVDKYIDQIAIIADQRKFVSALIIPVYPLLEEYAREHGIKFESREDLCRNEQINEMISERIDTLQQQLAHYEQIKRFTLLPHAFSMERGELTNTLKIKRRVLNENYKDLIDKMYED